MEEVWKDVEGFEGYYQVSNTGKVKRIAHTRKSNNQHGECYQTYPEKILKINKHKLGYMKVAFNLEGKATNFLVHRLVGSAFIDNPLNLPEINHINGIKDDNRVENLEWCDSKHNIRHAIETGLIIGQKGETNGMSKLKEDEVIEIYKLALKKEYTQTEIGSMYGVKKNAVSSIKLKTTWKHVTDNYDKEEKRP